MIGFLKGKVIDAHDGCVLLENNGIGYEIICSNSVFCKLVNAREGEVFTYLAVRDDGLFLYGFENLEEKNMFLKLITVSGVGPKMGIAVLSGMNLKNLAVAIASSDVKTLSTVKGLGKKTAERIILELREKITASDAGSGAEIPVSTGEVDPDAVIALMSLGFSRAESVKAVVQAGENGVSGLENLIAYSIKNIK